MNNQNSKTTKFVFGLKQIKNYLTITNCLTYAFLYDLQNQPNATQYLIDNPFSSLISALFTGAFYSMFANYFINNYTGLIFNGIMLYVNFNIFKSIK